MAEGASGRSPGAPSAGGARSPRRLFSLGLLSAALLQGCAVVAVADAVVTVGVTAVKVGATVVETTVDVAAAGVDAAVGEDRDEE